MMNEIFLLKNVIKPLPIHTKQDSAQKSSRNIELQKNTMATNRNCSKFELLPTDLQTEIIWRLAKMSRPAVRKFSGGDPSSCPCC